MKQIEAKTNQQFKRAKKLVSGNSDEKLLLVEGHKLLDEALKSGARPEMIFVETPQALRQKTDLEPFTYQIGRGLYRELSTVHNPGEILAFLAPPPSLPLEKTIRDAKLVLVLDRLQDPGNIGTIMRSAEAMGVDLLVMLKGSCSPLNPKVTRAAMGSSFRLPTASEVEPAELLRMLKTNGIVCICADMEGQPLPDFVFPPRCALVFGQEGQGLSKEILHECNSRLAIPMQGQVESLNVATSAAICLYEWARAHRSLR